MEGMSFRERNRQRRERNAFDNLYAFARESGIPDPKRTAERAARRFHSDPAGSRARRGGTASRGDGAGANGSGAGSAGEQVREVPHRLEERTRDQLYERAQELEIEGRSSMNKDELVEAIRAHR